MSKYPYLYTGLKDHEMYVLCMRLGLDQTGEKRTQKDVAKMMGLSESRVRQIEVSLHEKIRAGASEYLREKRKIN